MMGDDGLSTGDTQHCMPVIVSWQVTVLVVRMLVGMWWTRSWDMCTYFWRRSWSWLPHLALMGCCMAQWLVCASPLSHIDHSKKRNLQSFFKDFEGMFWALWSNVVWYLSRLGHESVAPWFLQKHIYTRSCSHNFSSLVVSTILGAMCLGCGVASNFLVDDCEQGP